MSERVSSNRIKQNKLCVAIPTYNSPDNIEKKLQEEAELFEKHSIDIYIFDSSIGDKTKTITERFSESLNDRIHYVRIDSNVSSNEKVFQIFEWASDSHYDYVWMIHDHTICNGHAIKFLLSVLEINYDFLLLNMQSGDYQVEDINDLDEFLLKGSWRLNSFGASILKIDTFLKGTDWDAIRRKYCDEKAMNYSHIGFYYERAAQINCLKVCQVHFDRKDFIDFNRTKQINWEHIVFRICLECWGEVITRLPDCYKNKTKALRTQDKWFMSKYSLLTYKRKKYYNIATYMRYKKWMKVIYPEDVVRNFWIAALPYGFSLRLYCRGLLNSIHRARKKEEKIYVFGAGRHAAECASFLKEIGEDIDGFLVSDKSGNPDEMDGKMVYRATDALKDRNSLVLLAVLTSGIPAVRELLNSMTNEKTKIEMVELA